MVDCHWCSQSRMIALGAYVEVGAGEATSLVMELQVPLMPMVDPTRRTGQRSKLLSFWWSMGVKKRKIYALYHWTYFGTWSWEPNKEHICTCCEDPVLNRYHGSLGNEHVGDALSREAVRLVSTQQVNDSGNEFCRSSCCLGRLIPYFTKRTKVFWRPGSSSQRWWLWVVAGS